MLRIHFSPEDLSRTHVAADLDPLWETVLSLQLLHNVEGRLMFDRWRRHVRPRVPRAPEAILLSLSPPRGDFADLLTPAAGVLGLETGLDSLRGTSICRIRRDLEQLAVARRLPGWCRRLADGDIQALEHVADAMRSWYDTAVAPYRDHIDIHFDADRAVRLRDAQVGGPERVLAGLPPPLSWQPPVLVSPYPQERDLHLNGRGLLLIPSFFCWRMPVTLIDPQLPPVLVYPLERDLQWLNQRPGEAPVRSDRAMAALLGSTRAAVLDAVGRGPSSTTDIAKRVHISAPTASEHAAILRGAGLIITCRDGNTVLHSLTAIGAALLNGLRPSRRAC